MVNEDIDKRDVNQCDLSVLLDLSPGHTHLLSNQFLSEKFPGLKHVGDVIKWSGPVLRILALGTIILVSYWSAQHDSSKPHSVRDSH